jgi:riboflavin biosynthesis pyrimidine reductase
MTDLIRLYPLPTQRLPLEGAYLAHNLRDRNQPEGQPYVYSNFVTSLDGRIAIEHPHEGGLGVPQATANPRDWRLFQELAAQADLILTSGRYLRDWAAGRAQEILRVDDPDFADLREWRQAHGLPPHADLAVLSRSLDFPIPEVLTAAGRQVLVITLPDPDPVKVRRIEASLGQVHVLSAGQNQEGAELVRLLGELGHRLVYSAAGPQIHHLLLASGVLDRLYLTTANRLLGGRTFSTPVDGPPLDPPPGMRLASLYLDEAGLDGLGQLFAAYDRVE